MRFTANLARLQDQGHRRDGPLACRAPSTGLYGGASVSAVTSGPTRAGRRRGPAGPKSGRPGGRERARSRRCPAVGSRCAAPGTVFSVRGALHVWRPAARRALRALEAQSVTQARYRAAMGSAWPDTDLVFTTRTGRPIEPRNLVRSFRRICEANHLRLTKVHHLRHTVASLLKALGVPARDAQIILGHSRLAVTLEVYTHTDDEAQLDALTRLHNLFDQA